MAINIDSNMSAVAHHVIDGAHTFPYAIDAHSAVSRFPGEWSFEPWSAEDAARARESIAERHARETEEAKAAGVKPPAPLPPAPEPPTPEEQAAIDEHAAAVAEANERLKVRREKLAAERAEAEQIAADEALVASPPPRPDPTIRRPFGRAGDPTPAELAAMERQKAKKAADDKMAQDKAEADRLAAAKV